MRLKGFELFCFWVLIVYIGLALLGYLITPDRTKDCNTQLPEISFLRPFEKACFTKEISTRFSNPLEVFTGIVKYEKPSLSDPADSVKYCRTYWMGTDRFGRDLFSRIIIGIRYTLLVALLSVLLSALVGVVLGGISGYFGGLTDKIINFIIGIFWALPSILFAFVILMAAGKNITSLFISIGVTIWADMARLVRGLILSQKEQNYVKASIAMGYSTHRILFREILPNVAGPVMVQASGNFALAVLLESGLSFMGLGLQPPIPTLGNIIQDQYTQAFNGQIIQSIIPAIVLVLLILSFQVATNSIRDHLDVKLSNN